MMATATTLTHEQAAQTQSWWTELGKTGIRVPRLSIGTGTFGWGGSSAQTRLGFQACVGLLRTAYDYGVTWFDSADQYGSHPHVREALKSLDRERVVITTKTVARTGEQARKDIQRFLRELGTDYIDIVLMHCLVDPNWTVTMRPVMEALTEAKEKGYIRAVGVSCHDIRALKVATEHPWVEVILARLNYAGVHMDGKPDEVLPLLRNAVRNGKGIYGMKVVGQGELTRDPEKAIRYTFGTGVVAAVTIGMVSEAEIRQNVAIVRRLFPRDQA
ncbi:General stress protein 69 [bacterium HR17]|uniref:General stress protein 69 n=1 Tax=Candidatus Fervidibacter japonicus TaxID=2035412 RepID=A0A2H5XBI2_9BACT|nr:General stress protein 69 [bacterium HR17]